MAKIDPADPRLIGLNRMTIQERQQRDLVWKRLFISGLSANRIASMFGYGKTVVTNRLSEMGIDLTRGIRVDPGDGTLRCCDCKLHRPKSAFSKSSRSSTGYQPVCKSCSSARAKAWRSSFSPADKERERMNDRSDARRAYWKRRRREDLHYRLKVQLRSRLAVEIHKRKRKGDWSGGKRASAIRDMGCSMEFFKLYIESLFQPGMSWENHGTVWTLDHKKPLSAFDLTDRSQLLEAVHYTNLQPLFAIDNIKKGGVTRPRRRFIPQAG